MARPKSNIDRKTVNTRIDVELVELLKKINLETGIPMNRLIEDAIRDKYNRNSNNEEV